MRESVIEGQVSIFDLPEIRQIADNPKEVIKTVLEKSTDDEIVNNHKDAIRIIKQFSGRYRVETEDGGIDFNRNGKEDCRFEWIWKENKGLESLTPGDKVLFAKEDLKTNEIQEKVLDDIKKEYKVEKVIKRYGDFNYIVIISDDKKYYGATTLGINQKGWIINYKSEIASLLEYTDEEVIFDNLNQEKKSENKVVEIGARVKVMYHNKEHEGKVVSIYGPGNETVNVIFNGMHSAFYIDHVKVVG